MPMPKYAAKSKYKAQPTIIDNIRFDSKKEANRYAELKLMEKAGLISELILQPVIKCTVNGDLVCKYIGDFSYYCRERKTRITEDAKGFRTDVYKLKKKLVYACTGIDIVEV